MKTAQAPEMRIPNGADVFAELQKISEKCQTFNRLLTTDAKIAYRGDRIRVALDVNESLTVDDAAELQMDSWSWLAVRMVPVLQEIRLDGYYAEGQALFDGWDFGHEPDSAAAAYFNAVYASTLELTYRDELP